MLRREEKPRRVRLPAPTSLSREIRALCFWTHATRFYALPRIDLCPHAPVCVCVRAEARSSRAHYVPGLHVKSLLLSGPRKRWVSRETGSFRGRKFIPSCEQMFSTSGNLKGRENLFFLSLFRKIRSRPNGFSMIVEDLTLKLWDNEKKTSTNGADQKFTSIRKIIYLQRGSSFLSHLLRLGRGMVVVFKRFQVFWEKIPYFTIQ